MLPETLPQPSLPYVISFRLLTAVILLSRLFKQIAYIYILNFSVSSPFSSTEIIVFFIQSELADDLSLNLIMHSAYTVYAALLPYAYTSNRHNTIITFYILYYYI